MIATVTIDDDLFATASAYLGLDEPSAVLGKALTALVARESARRLARIGGTNPEACAAPRRRSR
jgi:Arc/MetJ family transcription regulator